MERLILAGAGVVFALFAGCNPSTSPSVVGRFDPPDSLYRMMRIRTAEMKKLREWLLQDIAVADSFQRLYWPFAFADGIPTEGMHLTPMFPVYDRVFSRHYDSFYQAPSVGRYNMLVQTCEGCHQEHCSGPLRLIRRLYLEDHRNE